ncbi:MAG: hypothetical protein K2I60_00300, partial [Oscillospiraceae bacterium]|nr:hypothetical protein [Oscillospiraceae bacterium]
YMQGEVFDCIETFNGEFDGKGYTISNLSFKCFVKTNSGKISNINFKNGKLIDDSNIRGGFVVTNEKGGTIDNCSVDMNSEDVSLSGGFVGINNGKITNSETTLSVKSEDNRVGGFVSKNYGTIKNCKATGSINGGWYVGGFVGLNSGTITNCIATGNLKYGNFLGGFVGENNGTITNCIATGDLGYGKFLGGFVGENSGTITGAATGNISKFAGTNTGTITNLTKEFVISSKDDFATFMTTSEYWEINCKVNLTCDLDMQNQTFDYIETFSGRFEGGNHTISNLSFKCFVKTNNGKISNINFNGGKLIGDSCIRGGFVVTNEEGGIIDNCVIDMN